MKQGTLDLEQVTYVYLKVVAPAVHLFWKARKRFLDLQNYVSVILVRSSRKVPRVPPGLVPRRQLYGTQTGTKG